VVIALVLGFFAVRAMTNIFSWVWTVVVILIAAFLFRGVLTRVNDSVQKAVSNVEFVKIEKLSGSSTDSMSNQNTESFYEMHVGLETFRTVNRALIEYMEGCRFVVYFTKTTKQILSVEEVS
jgi:hypothetical protein